MNTSSLQRRRAFIALGTIAAVLLSACGSDDSKTTSARGDRNSSTSSLIKAYTYSSDAGQTYPVEIAYASDGSRYVLGGYLGTVDFDSSDAVSSLSSPAMENMFLAKHDSSGALQWVKGWEATSGVHGTDLEVDSHGDVVLAGTFNGNGDLDPGDGSVPVTTMVSNIFFEKLDSNGNYQWSQLLTGPLVQGIALLSDDSIVASGIFGGTQDFDGSSATNTLTATASGTRRATLDIYVLRMKSDGSFVSANRYGGTATEYVYDIDTDASNNVYLAGAFGGSTDFGSSGAPMTITAPASATSRSAFVAKIASSGAAQWIRGIGGASYNVALSIDVGNDGIVRVGGTVSNSSEMTAANPMTVYAYISGTDTPTVTATTLNGVGHGYVSMFTQDGTAQHIYVIGATSASDFVSSSGVAQVRADRSGNTYVAAQTYGGVAFQPIEGASPVTDTSANSTLAVFKISAGTVAWATSLKGLDASRNGAEARGLALDASGNLAVLAFIAGPYDLNPLGTAINVDPGIDTYSAYTIVIPSAGPVLVSTPTGSTETTSPPASGTAATDPEISVSVPLLQLRVSSPLTSVQVAGLIGLKYAASSKLTMKVASTSKKTCLVERKLLTALKTGACKVTVTAKPKKGKTKSKTGTITVRP